MKSGVVKADPGFTHVRDGLPAMVDVGGKLPTRRRAKAEAWVRLPPQVRARFDGGEIQGPKGPVFQAAILAGIQAAKRTWELIPLCHPVPLDDCKVALRLEEDGLHITCEAVATQRTGVEMEALTGAGVAALTVYDMCKGISQDMAVEGLRLLEKTGGKRDFRR